jgi:hypothetical protein
MGAFGTHEPALYAENGQKYLFFESSVKTRPYMTLVMHRLKWLV